MLRKKLTNKDPSMPTRRVESPNSQPKTSYKISRTLSGIRSSAFSPKISVESPRAKQHSLATHRKKTSFYLIIVLLVVAILIILIYQLTANVKVIVNDTRLTKPVAEDYYHSALTNYFDSHPIYRLRFVFNPKAVIEELKNTYPEIKDISDSGKTNLFDTSYLITFRKPVAGWKINDTQYFVDSDGVSFGRNYFSDPGVQIIDESGIRLEKGGLVTSGRFLTFVGKLVSVANENNYVVTEAKLPQDSTRQLNVKLQGINPYIKFSIDRGVAVQIEDMDRTLKFLYSRSINANYIDVRVSGKVFYK